MLENFPEKKMRNQSVCVRVAGNRQSDPKDERRRSQMAAARQVLERSTLMLLVSSKTSLR